MLRIICNVFAFTCINLLVVNDAREQCAARNYGSGSTVCVCNLTYCDNLDPIRKSTNGVIKLFESSKAGDRFKETELNFGHFEPLSTTKVQTVTINRNKKFQKIIGFGGSFTDSSGINIQSLHVSLRVKILEDYFSNSGIEYTIGRIPIAGSDFSTYAYSYADQSNDFNLTHFSLTNDDRLYKIPYIKIAEQISPHKPKWFGSPWSAPAWLKTTGTLNNGGVLIGEPGGKYYQTFADYFVKFLNAYKSDAINIWGITVTNEPDNGFKHLGVNRFNDLGFTPETQRDFVKLNLGPTLAKAGYGANNLKLILYDGEKRSQMLDWADVILNDTEAAKYVSGIGFHWYNNTKENIVNLDQTNEKYPHIFLISTEACDGWQKNITHVSLGNWTRAERYAYDIITDLNHWTASWVDWNLVLDLNGGPNWINNYVDAPVIVNATANEYYKQPLFYSLGHFSKFLTPDSVRIELKSTGNVANFETTGFVRTDNATVIIALNLNSDSVVFTVDDESHNASFTKVVKPHSIQSYIWFN